MIALGIAVSLTVIIIATLLALIERHLNSASANDANDNIADADRAVAPGEVRNFHAAPYAEKGQHDHVA